MPRSQQIRNSINLLWRSGFHYFRRAMLRPPYWISANGKTCRVLAGEERGAVAGYSEVVIEDCYGLFDYFKHETPTVIVDIGANVGMFSKLCTLLFPQAEIYSYEPNPSALKWLEKNATGTNIRIFPCAVGNHRGAVSFNTSYDSTLGCISNKGDLIVNCIAASEVAEGRQIDLLKMDCEGSEWSILRNTELLRRTRNLRLEYHLTDGYSLSDLRALVESGGHHVQALIEGPDNGKFGLLRSIREV